MDNQPLTLAVVKAWVPVGIMLIAGTTAWAVATTKIDNVSADVNGIKAKQAQYEQNAADLKNTVIQIKTILDERLPPKK